MSNFLTTNYFVFFYCATIFWRIDPSELMKHHPPSPTKGYLKIQMLFSEPQIKYHEETEILRANDDRTGVTEARRGLVPHGRQLE